MSLTPGSRVGPYEIQSPIGSGGMGEVFRARDSRLGRDVAMKVLPDEVERDPDRLARFEREAKALASLNHPNIAQIYGFEKTDATSALVMELVEGEDLSRRIARGAVPLDEALPLARQIAGALEAAHQQGIVHRDLKPANIKVRSDGTIKILDFGLSKMLARTEAGSGVEPLGEPLNPPSVTAGALTLRGTILGTPAYMSPEQVKGKPADKRADVWAFGCVVYEMITGRTAFAGESLGDTLSAVLTREPDWSALPPGTPPGLRRMLHRCLRKDPARRMRDLGDAVIEIDEAGADQIEGVPPSPRAGRWTERLAWLAAGAGVSVVALAFAWSARRPAGTSPEMRVEITTPPASEPASFAISPDARTLAFVAMDRGRPKLWLRSLDGVSAQPLPGTDGASFPFWAPGGGSIAFFADDSRLRRIDIADNTVRTLANAPFPRGGSWSADDVILFVPITGPVHRIAATGGASIPVTTIAPQQTGHAFPLFLPDGNHFVFYATGTPGVRGVYVAALDGTGQRRLTDADSLNAVLVRDHLLVVRSGTLYAQRFDSDRLSLTGNPFAVAGEIAVQLLASYQIAAIAASEQGHILYRSGVPLQQRQLVWFDRTGKETGTVGQPESNPSLSPVVSPDGRRIAIHRMVNGNTDIWLLDTERGGLSRFTTHPANDIHALWSPDGRRILFSSNRTGTYELYEKSTVGPAEERSILPVGGWPTDWSHDGAVVLFQPRSLKTNSDIWALPYGTGQKPFALVENEFEERDAQFAPDGRWLAYSSTESGRSEVYVQPFPGPGERTAVSMDGGGQPRWRGDGKELLFIGLDGRLMAVPISRLSNAETLGVGRPVPLFPTRVGGAIDLASRHTYIVSPDGSRFLMNTILEQPAASPVTLILNWRPR